MIRRLLKMVSSLTAQRGGAIVLTDAKEISFNFFVFIMRSSARYNPEVKPDV